MQFDYPIILALMSLSMLVVIILLKFIYRDNPHYNEEYGDEIVLFHSIGLNTIARNNLTIIKCDLCENIQFFRQICSSIK